MTALSGPLAPPRYATPTVVQKKAISVASGPATVTLDSTPTAGNILVGFYASRTGSPSQAAHVAPSGWAKQQGQGRGTGSPQMSAWTKTAGAGEPTSIQFSDPGSSGSGTLAVFELAGVTMLTGIDKANSEDGGSSNVTTLPTALALPEATTTPHDAVLACIAVSNTVTWANTWTNGFAQQTSTPMSSTALLIASSASAFSTNEGWPPTGRLAVAIILAFRATPA